MFEKKSYQIPLIEYAPLYVALDRPPGGGLWRVDAVNKKPQTGTEQQIFFVVSGQSAAALEYSAGTMVGLSESQLQEEVDRLRRIEHEAKEAAAAFEKFLAFRRGIGK
jgi:hypothetical protein